MMDSARRHDIDWVRVIAIALLLIYHIAISFQKWGLMIGFITNKESWDSLWYPMTMLNIWRIPLLFFVSGMGVHFAQRKRNWKEILVERTRRILVPFLVATFTLVPLQIYILYRYYDWNWSYSANPAHVWFLGNIFVYLIILLPLFYFIKHNKENKWVLKLTEIFQKKWGIGLVILAFMIEAILLNPTPYELYAMTWHGFSLGFLAFLFGFLFIQAGQKFWGLILKQRYLFLISACLLFIYRFVFAKTIVPVYMISLESNMWIFAVFAFSYNYLNRPSKTLSYLSKAAYPVYILHILFMYLGSMLIFPLDLNVYFKFVLLVIFTLSSCLLFYEFIICRIRMVKPLFGVIEK